MIKLIISEYKLLNKLNIKLKIKKIKKIIIDNKFNIIKKKKFIISIFFYFKNIISRVKKTILFILKLIFLLNILLI
jgi:hypothetical protein